MIEMAPLSIAPPEEAVDTTKVPKPEPDVDPLPIFEVSHLLDFSDIGGGTDRAVLFSGGDDSLVLTHLALENGWADFVIHLETNSSIPENTDFVRRTCREYQWPLAIIPSPVPLDIFAYRYGFPGPSEHTSAFHSFKGRQLAAFHRKRNGGVKFLSGVRALESDRRMKHIEAEVEYASRSDGDNFDGWWISPLHDRSDAWLERYRKKHGLPSNPVNKRIHRSGDCQCLAYGSRGSELTMIEAEYPDFGRWLRNVETRVQEYRGRVRYLEDQYPDLKASLDKKRKETRPNPFRLTLLKNSSPRIFEEVTSLPTKEAINRGRTDPTNYIGHGGLSSKELRQLVADADQNQKTLCDTCGGKDTCPNLSPSVRRQVEEASDSVGVQVSLP